MSHFEQKQISLPSIRFDATYIGKIEIYSCYTYEINFFLSFNKYVCELVCQ